MEISPLVAHEKFLHALQVQNAGRTTEALYLYQEILNESPYHQATLYSVAVIYMGMGDLENALRITAYGIQIVPPFAPLFFAHAEVLKSMGRRDEALRSYDWALEIDPEYKEVLINSGTLFREKFQYKEAIERFNRVLMIDPEHVSALANCGIMLTEYKQSEYAIQLFERLLKVKPDYDYGLGLLCSERQHICDWNGLEEISQQIVEGVAAGKRTCKTLALMAISDDAELHLKAAKIFAEGHCPPAPAPVWQGERYRHRKIRVAYVSPDLREHPVGHLIAGVFEHHDKSRFETIGVSIGIDDNSRLRHRMVKAFDHFIDAKDQVVAETVRIIREMEVDILVDLAGYTSDSRTSIFAQRPAPIQVNFLGYPGTMGAEYMDYILADRTTIPEEHQRFYMEKVVYLPDTYLPTDASIALAETPTRAACGLPDDGIVFCSFSHDYKLSPHIFAIWMRLLQKVPGSVLWLMSRSELSQRNLQNEAALRGIDPARLIFAQRVPRIEDHLARYRQADLFLDTHPYNAHTTAADALMAGLPVVTYLGGAFQSRVASSLVRAMGVPELVTESLEAYEALALALATHPEQRAALREKLAVNKTTQALFDTEGFCRNIENAYIAMWRQYQLGEYRDALCTPLPKVIPHPAVRCLFSMAEYYGRTFNAQQVIAQHRFPPQEAPSLALLAQMATSLGLKAQPATLSIAQLLTEKPSFPILARLNNGNAIILLDVFVNGKFAVVDPLEPHAGHFLLGHDVLALRWNGEALLF